MTSLDHLIPSIKDYFPGKPLTTGRGDAFILEELKQDDTFMIQFTKAPRDKEKVRSADFVEERDADEILYD
jgi:hypothetical protein